MNIFRVLFILFLLSFSMAEVKANADDYRQGDKIIRQIDFEEDSIKAIYDWVADNIRYDIKKVGTGVHYKSKQHFIDEAIRSKTGVCQHYSELFNALVKRIGYEGFVIAGYIVKGGRIGTDIGHAWNVVRRNGEWKLYDVTWGAGVLDNGFFRKKYDDSWFEMHPNEFVKSHVPFDPIWQLRSQPVDNIDFANGKLTSTHMKGYNYQDSIAVFLAQKETDQIRSAFRRMKSAGVNNPVVESWVAITEHNIGVIDHNLQVAENNKKVDVINETMGIMNEVVSLFNEYMSGKNNRFRNRKWTDDKLKASIVSMRKKTTQAIDKMKSIQETDEPELIKIIKKNLSEILEVRRKVDKETEFMMNYIEASPDQRKRMF